MCGTIYSPRQKVQKSYLKEGVKAADIRLFRNKMQELLSNINEYESEEYNKNAVIKFLGDNRKPIF